MDSQGSLFQEHKAVEYLTNDETTAFILLVSNLFDTWHSFIAYLALKQKNVPM